MSQIEQVIAAAKSIAIKGHTPTIALIKSRVGKLPMPAIVQGLQQFKAIPQSEWKNIADVNLDAENADNTPQPTIEELLSNQKTMQQHIQALTDRVTELEKLLTPKAK
ncbi:hypothetical protein [Shewanella gaetbuli]|uniref:KfrA N-terminal DNA-binding domain-containing protein n=1 Tax=Shewanella gaetbuli TaxID=220752 RepID=A0A9X1ZSR4_9GAMM|nr:hypothetical protein [Shewanella gaetbuli]MCL1143398.1 hypothetical protein [Shewanella gaetbuli]